MSTAEESKTWVAALEAEENERLESLLASINAFEAEETPTQSRVNALLVSALQGQLTLMRMSRVFPERKATKRLDVSRALRHRLTLELASRLHRCWRSLGLTGSTVKQLLREAFTAVGAQTRTARVKLFSDLIPTQGRGIDPKAHVALEAEGSGQ